MIHPYNGILFSNKQEQTINMYNNLYKSPGNQADWEKPILKCHILYDSTCVTFLKWVIIKSGEEVTGCQGSRWRWGEEVGVSVTKGTEQSLQWRKCSVSWYWCQWLSCGCAAWCSVKRLLPWGQTGWVPSVQTADEPTMVSQYNVNP